jgi:hypothetical protein
LRQGRDKSLINISASWKLISRVPNRVDRLYLFMTLFRAS